MTVFPGRFYVGPCVADPHTGEVVGPEGPRHLEPKAMLVLQALSASYPQPLTKDELLSTVWGGEVYSDDAVHRAIAKIRKALGDDSRRPAILETIPKRGYRLIAMVSESAPGVRPDSDLPTIAVLPFGLHSSWRSLDYLADGATKDLIVAIEQLNSMFVLQFDATRRYGYRESWVPAAIGRELGVDWVVTGSVRPRGGVCQFEVALYDVAVGQVYRRAQFDCPASEFLGGQNDLSGTMAACLERFVTKPLKRTG